jgi:hypothetical protein
MMAGVDLSAEIEAQLVEAFPADDVDQARGILNPSQDDRVLRAVLTLSEGDLERLRHYSEVAEPVYRDVLGRRLPGNPTSLAPMRRFGTG